MTYCSERPVQDYLQECRTGRPVTTEQINGQTNRFETTRRRESCHGNKYGHDSARRRGVFISMCLGACIHHESSHPHRNANSPERDVWSQPEWGDKFKRKCGRSVKWELTSHNSVRFSRLDRLQAQAGEKRSTRLRESDRERKPQDTWSTAPEK